MLVLEGDPSSLLWRRERTPICLEGGLLTCLWRGLLDDPAMCLWRGLLDDPAMCLWRGLLDDPEMCLWRGLLDDPALAGSSPGDVRLLVLTRTLRKEESAPSTLVRCHAR